MDSNKRVLIVGGGFAGINAARNLGNLKGVHVTIIDRRNHHLFQPLLYQVAMAALSPADIATPIRAVLSGCRNVDVLLGNVTGIDLQRRIARTSFADIPYDYLILACGANQSYFGHSEWEESAPGLKSLEEATEIRRRMLIAYELAERERNPAVQKEYLTFIIVGGGPTGVELAGAIGEISRYTITRDFRHVDPRQTRVILIEGGPRILPTFDPELSARARRGLEKLGVTVWTGSVVSDVRPDGVRVGKEFVNARTVLWAAGVAPAEINQGLKLELDRAGRIMVEADLSVKGHPEVFVLGDQCNFSHGLERPLPGLAPVAIQMGRFSARQIAADLKGKPRKNFHYVDKGTMATIGRADAVVSAGPLKLSGFLAWLGWLFVHIFFLIGFRNRVSVFLQWAYSYLSLSRGARLITSRHWRSDKRFDLAQRYAEIFEEKMAEIRGSGGLRKSGSRKK
ncbi:MAG: NAD(P)/FAD-dependent oxidoreductase [Leptospirales bacterium]|nr:NAD(P)/FAD-dependent oxidoreductase [Leptospirales bacterium]